MELIGIRIGDDLNHRMACDMLLVSSKALNSWPVKRYTVRKHNTTNQSITQLNTTIVTTMYIVIIIWNCG